MAVTASRVPHFSRKLPEFGNRGRGTAQGEWTAPRSSSAAAREPDVAALAGRIAVRPHAAARP